MGFECRKRDLWDEGIRQKDHLAGVLKDGEERADKRIACRMREAERRAYMSAQKRGEQQKVLRELQREQDRVWDNWYAKNHPEVKKQASPRKKDGASGLASKTESASDSKLPQLRKAKEHEAFADEEIFRYTSKSHAMYSEKIESWKLFVTENERRTAAYWQKKLGPDHVAYTDKLRSQISLRQKRTSQGMARTMSKSHEDSVAEEPASSSESKPSPSSNTRGTIRGSISSFRRSTAFGAEFDADSWQNRLQRCADNVREQGKQREEQWKHLQDSLYDAGQRRADFHAAAARRCTVQGEIWEQKNKKMSVFRQNQGNADKNNLDKKMTDFKSRRENMVKQRLDETFAKGSARQAHIKSSVAAARAAAEDLANERAQKQQLKDEQTATHYDTIFKGLKDQELSEDSLKVAEEKKEKGRELDAAVKKKAQAEIDKKESRYAKFKAQRELSMVERAKLHREKKKQKARPISASNASLLEAEYSTDEENYSPHEATDGTNADSSPTSGSPATGSPLAGPILPTITMPTFHETVLNLSFRSGLSEATAISAQDSTTRSLLAGMPSSTRSQACMQALRDLEREVEVVSAAQEAVLARNVQRPRSAGSHGGGDSSDDGEFIKGLETRSAKWLTDMRQKMDQAGPMRC